MAVAVGGLFGMLGFAMSVTFAGIFATGEAEGVDFCMKSCQMTFEDYNLLGNVTIDGSEGE